MGIGKMYAYFQNAVLQEAQKCGPFKWSSPKNAIISETFGFKPF